MVRTSGIFVAAGWLGLVNAHLAAWHKGMYCINGPQDNEDLNSYAIVEPLYEMSQSDWFFHHANGCDNYPPPDGEFLELPAGGSFTVEIASNRAKTTLSYDGRYTSDWPDGGTYPEDYNVPTCITSPNMHTQNQSMAAGTAFAISYNSDIKQVTPENLVVFSIKYHTPWKRVTTYDVPAAMPPCPEGGCICAWGWVPDGCGQSNIYHQPFKCKVTGSTSNTPVAAPKAPVWCQDDESKCVTGAKQMIAWNQLSGQNVFVDGFDLQGEHKSPVYNMKMGFHDGAQNDIFEGASSSGSSSSSNNNGGSNNSNGGSNTSSGDSGSSNGSSSNSNGSSGNSNGGSSNSNGGSSNSNDGSNNSNGDPSSQTGNNYAAAPSVSSSSSAPVSTSEPTASTSADVAPTSVSSTPARQCKRRTRKRAASLEKKAITHIKVHHHHNRDLHGGNRWARSRLAGDS